MNHLRCPTQRFDGRAGTGVVLHATMAPQCACAPQVLALKVHAVASEYFVVQACRWRIGSMKEFTHAVHACGAALRTLAAMVRFAGARTPDSRYPPAGHRREVAPPRWRPCGRRGVLATEAPVAH